jgi:hypothetical protein
LGRARYRGRAKVQIQAYMVASVQNLKRVIEVVLSGLSSCLEKLSKLLPNLGSNFIFKFSVLSF